MKELREKLDSLKLTKLAEENERNRVAMRKKTIEGIADSLWNPVPLKEHRGVDVLSESGLEGLGKFLDFYGSKAAEFDAQLVVLDEKLKVKTLHS